MILQTLYLRSEWARKNLPGEGLRRSISMSWIVKLTTLSPWVAELTVSNEELREGSLSAMAKRVAFSVYLVQTYGSIWPRTISRSISVIQIAEKWYSFGLLNLRVSLNISTYVYKPFAFLPLWTACSCPLPIDFSTRLLVFFSLICKTALYVKEIRPLFATQAATFSLVHHFSFDFMGCVCICNFCPAEIFIF